jgi:Spy/CpxP family protein refolding chaperone
MLRTVLALLALAGLVSLAVGLAGAEDAPLPIKEIMKQAHGGGANSLLNKATGANASKEDKEKLLNLYKDLAANKPPQGDEKSWGEKTSALVKAAEANVKGEAGAGNKVRQAANCMACHRVHRPS